MVQIKQPRKTTADGSEENLAQRRKDAEGLRTTWVVISALEVSPFVGWPQRASRLFAATRLSWPKSRSFFAPFRGYRDFLVLLTSPGAERCLAV